MIDVAASPSAARTGARWMTRRSLIASAILTTPGLAGCAATGPLYQFRYKLTLQVETSGRISQGANVVEVRKQAYGGPNFPLGAIAGTAVTGEANVVDLGEGRLLVALLTGLHEVVGPDLVPLTGWGNASPEFLLERVYRSPSLGMSEAGQSPGLRALAAQRGAKEIGPEDLPTLVTFRDPADPLTIEQVDPRNPSSNFGFAVRLARATIEVTSEPVTHGIEKRLPWLAKLSGGALDGSATHYSNALSNTLSVDDFVRTG